ncbi:hypothetical protein V1525DRAFT_345326 [Lipomyces kononenkoae]|uniref:Uncharacterized protein n=1 Tax=Lipomyces kononenkoae TaxID=34357 RepID=A0ACC3SZT8_LIPKO
MMISLLGSLQGAQSSPRAWRSTFRQPSPVFASCAFISSMIVLLLLTAPMTLLSSKSVDISPIIRGSIAPPSSALPTSSLALATHDSVDRSCDILSQHTELSSLDLENPDESALTRGSNWHSNPSKSVSRCRARRTASTTSPSPAAREHYPDDGKPTSACSDKSTARDNDNGHRDCSRQPDYDLLIDPPLFSPPDKRMQQGWVVLVVGVITIVTASLMM